MAHLLLHAIVPLVLAWAIAPGRWRRAYLLMMLAMLIDLDHLLASPIYDPGRCSVGFHPLHGVVPVALYVLMLLSARTRVLAIGLVVHIALDALDCRFTNGVWYVG